MDAVVRRSATPPLRQQADQHVAAIQRRHGNHVEDGEQHVDDGEREEQRQQRRSYRARRRYRPVPRRLAQRRGQPRRCRPSRGCSRARRRRSARSRASGVSGIAGSTGTGFAQPISGTLVRNAINGNSSVPIGSTWTAGLSDRRPSWRAVGSPRRSAAKACAASCTDNDAMRTDSDDENLSEVDAGHTELNIRAYHAHPRGHTADRREQARSTSACVVRKLTMHARSAKRPLMVAFDTYDSPSRWTSTINCLLKAHRPSAVAESRRC